MRIRTRRALALAGSAVALSLALTGCSVEEGLLGDAEAQRDEDGNVTEQQTIAITDLMLGDCMLAGDSTGEIQELDVVPCSDAHVDEVFFEFELTDRDLPSTEEITAEVEAQCVPAFNDFVGFDYYDSTLKIWWLTPTEDTWTQTDDRLVQCVIYEPDPADETGKTRLEITGSLEGAAR